MLGISCLLNNGNLVPEIKDLVEGMGWKMLSEEGNASIENLYKGLRKEGFEIDMQTLSHIYGEVFHDHPWFSSSDELEQARSQSLRDLIDAEAEEAKLKEIGRNNPVVAAVNLLMKQVKLVANHDSSIQKIFQDRLIKAAKRVVGYQAETANKNKTAEDILREVLSLENRNKFGPGFSAMENAERLWNEFRREFNEVADELEKKDDVFNAEKIRQYADILEGATYKFLMSTGEIQKVIKTTMSEAGYTKKATSPNGTVRESIDWNKVFSDSGFDFTETIKEVFRKKGFSEPQLDRIAAEMVDEWNKLKAAKMASSINQRNKNKAGRAPVSAIQKLQNLYNMGIFQNANQKALFNVLGVQPNTQAQVNLIQNLMAINNKAMQNPLSQWSATYLKSIQREVEIVIEQAEENKEWLVNAIRKWSFFNQLNNSLLLANPQNFTENLLSGTFQTMLTMLFTQPGQAFNSLMVLSNVFVDVMKGGVREGHEMVNTFNSSGNLEDRYNFETANTASEKTAALFGVLPRLMLSTFDNAFKAAMIHNIGLDMVKKELIRQGASVEEANLILNEAFYGNRDEIETLAKQMTSDLQMSGIEASNDKWKRIAAEMSWANMVTEGQFFQDVLDGLKARGQVDPNFNPNIDKAVLKSIRNAAEQAASRGLGHQSDSVLLSAMDRISQLFGQKISEARRNGHGLAGATALQGGFAQINKFRFGAFRWLWLTIEKTSGIALLGTLITDVAMAKKRGRPIRYSDIDFNINPMDQKEVNKLEDQLASYASLKQRLIRQSIAPLIGFVSLQAFQAMFIGDGDDNRKKRQWLQLAERIQKDRMLARWYQKLLPPSVYNYLTTIAHVDTNGQLKLTKLKDIKLPLDASMDLKRQLLDLFVTFKNNYNESQMQNIFESINGIATGKKGAAEKLGGQLVGAIFTSPLKSFELWQKSFESRPILNSSQYRSLQPDNWWEGIEKEFMTEKMWKGYKGVK